MDIIDKLKQETFESVDRKASCTFGLPNRRIEVVRFGGGPTDRDMVNPIYFWRYNGHPIRISEARSILDSMQRESKTHFMTYKELDIP